MFERLPQYICMLVLRLCSNNYQHMRNTPFNLDVRNLIYHLQRLKFLSKYEHSLVK